MTVPNGPRMSVVGGNQKATNRAHIVTSCDTQSGYKLGYFWSERADFELKMARDLVRKGGICPKACRALSEHAT